MIMPVPVEITRRYKLNVGDQVYWIPEPDDPSTVKLKILKLAEINAKISAL